MTTTIAATTYGFLAFCALAAQGRLGKDSALAIDTHSQVDMARMSAEAWKTYSIIEEKLLAEGEDVHALMQPYRGLIGDMEARLRPGDWWERVVKTYVLFGIFTDLYGVVTDTPMAEVGDHTGAEMGDFGHGEWARKVLAERLKESVETQDSVQTQDRLSLWGRRVYGDAIGMIRDALNRTPIANVTDADLKEFAQAHQKRMKAAGLAG